MSHTIYYVYTKEGEQKGACQHSHCSGYRSFTIYATTCRLAHDHRAGMPQAVHGAEGNRALGAMGNPKAATGSLAALPSCSVV